MIFWSPYFFFFFFFTDSKLPSPLPTQKILDFQVGAGLSSLVLLSTPKQSYCLLVSSASLALVQSWFSVYT